MHKHNNALRGGLFGTALLTLAGCTGPLFGPGGFDNAALENGAPPELVKRFHEADTDGNGFIDPVEARAAELQGLFTTLDEDRDRKISKAEFINGMQQLDNNQ
ncbi:EF-hand domain-containing protein [Kushneria sp. AK178]